MFELLLRLQVQVGLLDFVVAVERLPFAVELTAVELIAVELILLRIPVKVLVEAELDVVDFVPDNGGCDAIPEIEKQWCF